MQKFKLQSSGSSYVARIIDEEGKIVALALQMGTGDWRLADINENLMDSVNHHTRRQALKAYTEFVNHKYTF